MSRNVRMGDGAIKSGVEEREANKRLAHRRIALQRIIPHRICCCVHISNEPVIALGRQRAQQIRFIGKVPGRGGMGHAEIAGQRAQAQALDPLFCNHMRCPVQQAFPQISMMIGQGAAFMLSLTT